MKVSLFVTGSAALLALWLGVTFVQEIPARSYQQLGKGSVPLSSRTEKPAPTASLKGGEALEVAQTTPAPIAAPAPAKDPIPAATADLGELSRGRVH